MTQDVGIVRKYCSVVLTLCGCFYDGLYVYTSLLSFGNHSPLVYLPPFVEGEGEGEEVFL